MDITIIGTGFIGTTLGRALAESGHRVTFGSRHPADDHMDVPGARVAPIGEALSRSDPVILAIPGAAVAELGSTYGDALAGKLVIDATNRMGDPVPNGRAFLPPTVRYARAFNTLGGENFADPVFSEGRADLFFSAPEDDRPAVEEVIEGVGLRPVYVGDDQEAIIDALFQLWIALALKQGRGRRLALRLLEN
ncbi:MAG: NAD(P)-binding domain-containing protein [Acidimicrobiales bacterium]|jgi:predicted dinucleotide-binding enzyme